MNWRKFTVVISLLLIVAGVTNGQVAGRFASTNADASEIYYLSVVLNDGFSPDLRVLLPVKINKAFSVQIQNGDITTTISGTVLEAVEGKYPLDLSISEQYSTTNRGRETWGLKLELDRLNAAGTCMSLCNMRAVTLSKIRPKSPLRRD